MACALVCLACGKARDDRDPTENAGTGGAGIGEAGAPSDGGSAGDAGDAGSGGLAEFVPLPSDARLLVAREYAATTSDLLGAALPAGHELYSYSGDFGGFDNDWAANGISGDREYELYFEAAEQLADSVFASDALRARFVTCAAADAACARDIIDRSGLRLFRRPLLDGERASYEAAYASARMRGVSHDGAMKEVLTALLASAAFLYRFELLPESPGASAVQPVSQYDLATRLSYFLWSSAPDEALLDAAQNDQLSTEAQLSAAAQRLLDDPKGKRFADSFGSQWLRSKNLPGHAVDRDLYPWSQEVANAATAEMSAWFAALLEPRASMDTFFTSTTHYVNDALAPYYGLTATGPDLKRTLLDGVDRRGFLGLVGTLALNSPDRRTSPSLRGKWIMVVLLCLEPGIPPANVPELTTPEWDTRAYLDGLQSHETCAPCHRRFDPIGLALENYDAVGRYRTTYPNGAVIDPAVSLEAVLGVSGPSAGMAGLSAALTRSPVFESCVSRKLQTYAYGRTFADAKDPNVAALTQRWQQTEPRSLREMILQLVQSPTFRLRDAGGVQ